MVLRSRCLNVPHKKLADAVGDAVDIREAESPENRVGGPGRRGTASPAEEYVLTLSGEIPVRIENLSCRHPGSREYEMTRLCSARLGLNG